MPQSRELGHRVHGSCELLEWGSLVGDGEQLGMDLPQPPGRNPVTE
jgi:hypothetical protein